MRLVKLLRAAWRVPDLRKKLRFVLFVIIVYRLGCAVTLPFIDLAALKSRMSSLGSTVFGLIDAMGGGAFSRATLFALGVQPYISAGIIIQLLCVAIPRLGEIRKEQGDVGKKKMDRYTYFAAAAIAVLQSLGYYAMIRRYGLFARSGALPAVSTVLLLSAGAALLTWLAQRVEKKGVGNGVTIVLFAGITARLPSMLLDLARTASAGVSDALLAILAIAILAAMMLVIVIAHGVERRVPVRYAAPVRKGRAWAAPPPSFLPLKLAMAGVMPVIFAQSVLSLPATVWSFVGLPDAGTAARSVYDALSPYSWIYIALYAALIFGFSYFYNAIQSDPIEIANNLKARGGFVPGYRPGLPTAQVIAAAMSAVTFFGAAYLAAVALVPILASKASPVLDLAVGGTSLIILAGAAIETVKAIEGQLSVYSYKGFLS